MTAAQLTAGATGLLPESETSLDTTRIQAALDACPAGQVLERLPDRPYSSRRSAFHRQ